MWTYEYYSFTKNLYHDGPRESSVNQTWIPSLVSGQKQNWCLRWTKNVIHFYDRSCIYDGGRRVRVNMYPDNNLCHWILINWTMFQFNLGPLLRIKFLVCYYFKAVLRFWSYAFYFERLPSFHCRYIGVLNYPPVSGSCCVRLWLC